ncbi:metal-sensitive transcriptional regulator [Serpentinicella sp. ANB-PHB4]|uniref:metal-sensitive transcriptional regulator n=1 Tax=Serpentinicella sp. ANB-PHB4 TaxID=3074076 RepID=UPI0028624C09|nr:metal-sensitive transcriptional regulator [Serpentinicella sp. ANB-PHB4]MDR5658699.1 metal-sensitive transcriptional regulator [Serpentinicella sp. ANB-PHB4]
MDNKLIKKDMLTRLRTIKGHIQGIENMIEEDKPCESILMQIAAVRSSIDKVGTIIIEDHAKDCLLKDNLTKDEVDQLLKTVIKFTK